MTTTPTVSLNKIDGVCELNALHSIISSLEDGKYTVAIKRATRKRTNNQNDWLWGVVYPRLQQGLIDAGWEIVDIEQVHELCKSNFAAQDLINPTTGEVVSLPSSTAKMTTTQFTTYVDKIRSFAGEYLNITIPDPNEQT